MRLILSVLIAFALSFTSSAQDSTKDSVQQILTDSLGNAIRSKSDLKSYGLYNFSAPYLSNLFNSNFRSNANNRLDLDFDFNSNSNSVPASMAYALLFNGPVTQKMIDRGDKMMPGELKFEENLKTGLTYRRYLKKPDLILTVGYDYRTMVNLSAPKQAYETAFYGNARFAGDTANLSNINFQYYNYNQLSIGIFKTVDYGKYQVELGFSASYLQVINNLDIETGTGTNLYTAPYGEYLNINYNLIYNSALNGQAPDFTKMPGFGVSGDIHIAFKNKDKWKIAFDLTDFGIMTFRKTPLNYTGSNSILFQGIVIPNLAQFSPSTFDTLNIGDTLKAKLPGQTGNAYSLFLPFNASLVFSKPVLNDRLVLDFGLLYRHLPGYNVYGYFKANYFFDHNMVISASAGAGGYSLFNLGCEFAKSWKYFDIGIGSSNLIGLVAPCYFPGSSLYLRMGASF